MNLRKFFQDLFIFGEAKFHYRIQPVEDRLENPHLMDAFAFERGVIHYRGDWFIGFYISPTRAVQISKEDVMKIHRVYGLYHVGSIFQEGSTKP